MTDELPDGWALALIPDVSELNPIKPKAALYADNLPVSFVPMPAVDADVGAITKPIIRPFGEVRKGFTSFQNDDVILAKITPCMENGKAAIARGLTNGLGFGSTEFHVMRSNGAVLPEYLFYFIRQESFRRAAENEMTGSVGQKRVPAEFLEGVEVPLPPLAEQRRIVAAVEAVLAKVNAARDRLNRVPAILKRFRQAVLSAACSGRLTADWRELNTPSESAPATLARIGEVRRVLWERMELERFRAKGKIPTDDTWKRRYSSGCQPKADSEAELPDSWEWATVSQIARLDVGFAFKSSEYAEQGIRLLRGENVEPGSLRWQQVRFWPKHKLDGLEHLLIESGEIILALDRPIISTGLKIARAKPDDLPCLLVQRMMRFKMVDSALTDFLYLCLQTPSFLASLHDSTTGSDLPHITGTGVAEFTFPFPPLAEQQEIVRRVDKLFALADVIEARLTDARQMADRLTQAVLAKAFRGELVPTEAELARRENRPYEPASELLARIRAEREQAGAAPKPSRRKRNSSL